MAKQSLKIVTVGDVLEWRDRQTDRVVFSFDVRRVHADLVKPTFRYGVKQIIADGGATGVNVPLRDRINKMATRAQSLTDGTWGERRAAATTHESLWAALIALNLIADTPEKRAQFKTLPASGLAKLYARADVAEWIAANVTSDAVDDFLDEADDEPADDEPTE